MVGARGFEPPASLVPNHDVTRRGGHKIGHSLINHGERPKLRCNFGVRLWCALVYSGDMSTTLAGAEAIRRSISLPAEMAEKLDGIAAARHVSANRAIIDLLADAITAYEQRRAIFLELADRFQKSTDPVETERLRDELANMTFGH